MHTLIHLSRAVAASALHFGALVWFAAPLLATDAAKLVFVEAADPRIEFSDAHRVLVDEVEGSVHFDRVIEKEGRGFRWDSPGSRMRWRTDSAEVIARIRFSERHTGTSRNSIGRYLVDGRMKKAWRFTRPEGGDTTLSIPIATPGDGFFHDYELILPYGDSVDLLGVEVEFGSRWRAPSPRPEVRWLAFGDSVTHGFTASEVTRSYAFRVAERNRWELLNLGIGGRGTFGPDGAFLAGVDADVYSILIGVNDWQAGAELASFRANWTQLLQDLRAGRPESPIFAITPLWVPASWQPKGAQRPLDEYRAVVRDVVRKLEDPRITLVEGPTLIDHDDALFDPIAVHPNDAGFSQMAARLAEIMRLTVEEVQTDKR